MGEPGKMKAMYAADVLYLGIMDEEGDVVPPGPCQNKEPDIFIQIHGSVTRIWMMDWIAFLIRNRSG